ncbi:MAG: amidohydrolase family protein [Bryobacteraceae bacterium]
MRIDAHQHFWDLELFIYPWMPPHPSPISRTFLPGHLSSILERNHFDGSIVIQATTDKREADWLLELSEQNAFILGVVGWVNLSDKQVGHTLDRLQKHPKFKGVRHPVHDELDDDWLLRADVISGLKELERRSIPYDLLVRTRHLACIPGLVEKMPSLPLVIDHIAKPLIRQREFDKWAAAMECIAQLKHVHVKLSGMITEADWSLRDASQLRPYVEHIWSRFGAERCMFGSDWPVCLLAGSWKEALAGLTQALGPQPQQLRDEVMGATAARFYKV